MGLGTVVLAADVAATAVELDVHLGVLLLRVVHRMVVAERDKMTL